MRLSVKERILVRLMELGPKAEAWEVPPAATQEGLAEAVGIQLRHVSQYLRPLLTEGLVTEHKSHVKGVRQRRRTYALTDIGKITAFRIRAKAEAEVVRIREGAGERDAVVSELLRTNKETSLLQIAREAAKRGPIDVARLARPPQPTFVEVLGDAPQVKTFVGRREELRLLTSDSESARLIVVRGMAGIGKTWLAAQVCNRLRGTRNLFWHRVRSWDTRESILQHVGDFLVALGKPTLRAVLAHGHPDRANDVLRENLRGTQALLVFDDAHQATQEARAFFRMLLEALGQAVNVRAIILTRTAIAFYDRRDVVLKGLVQELDLNGLEMSEVFTFLSTDGGPVLTAPYRHRILGHPLLLELYRARRTVPSQSGGDVRRFLEEVVYSELPPAARQMMGIASLYEVPVPRDALFADSGWSHDVLLSLTERCLVRRVGEERFEAHDVIREAFAALLTPAERHRWGAFAVRSLEDLSANARKANRFADCADYLANALRLSEDPSTRARLWESLGDVEHAMGDLLALSVAYREGLKGMTQPEEIARLYRKLASSLCDHGEFGAAAREITNGFRTLADVESVEQAWLDLVQCRISNRQLKVDRAIEPGERALLKFREFGEIRGQAEACLELGEAAAHLGSKSPKGAPLADSYFEEGLPLSDALGDVSLRLRFRARFAALLGERHGDIAKASDFFSQAAALVENLEDPYARIEFLCVLSWFRGALKGDFAGAEAPAVEALRLANQVHDAGNVVEAKYLLASAVRDLGRVSEARRLYEEAADDSARLGMHPDRVLHMFGYAAECYLAEGDLQGFRRLFMRAEELGLTRQQWPYLTVLQGLDCLVRDDVESACLRFREALQSVEREWSGEEALYAMGYSLLESYYAIALVVRGDESEAEIHRNRALEIYRTHNFRGRLLTAANRERRLVEGIRRIAGSLDRGSEAPREGSGDSKNRT